VFRSRTRNVFERLRRQFTVKRPYRCHACNWRAWAADGTRAVSPQNAPDPAAPPPDLGAIDTALDDSTRKPGE
jgi:hypothetical protein